MERPTARHSALLNKVGRRRQTLVELAYEELLSAILYRRLKPGDPLLLDVLAAQLGMSRTPVNSALYRLEAEGLVSYTEHVGYIVRILSPKELGEIFDMRVMYESYAVESGLRQASAAQIAAVASIQREIESSTDWADPEAYRRFWELDGQFHGAIVRLSSNDMLYDWFGRLHYHIHGVRVGLVARQAHPFHLMLQEHAAIVAALEQRDLNAAREALGRHIRRARNVALVRLATLTGADGAPPALDALPDGTGATIAGQAPDRQADDAARLLSGP